MNKKALLLFFILLFISPLAWSQTEDVEEQQAEEQQVVEQQVEEERPRWREKVFFGGGGGLQFSNIGTYVAVLPSVGYWLTPKWSTGIIANYQFVHYRDFDRSVHNYGGSLFTRYHFLPQFFATAEYEQINMNILRFNGESDRRWVDRALVGAGYFQSGRGRGGFYIALLYDLYYTNNQAYPYHSPIVYRAGFIF